ncbi:MAG: RHS repeat-associated core domain-containing protein [Chloroflexota bacterium]
MRFFYVTTGKTLKLINLSLKNGYALAPQDGGAIVNNGGYLYLTNCKILNNKTSGLDDGGAIYNVANGTCVAVNTLFSGNSAWNGGAIYNASGTLNMQNCQVNGNSANRTGGAIWSASSNSLTIQGCTFSHNKTVLFEGASGSGGAIAVFSGPTKIENNHFYQNTVTRHSGTEKGAAIYFSGAFVTPFVSGDSIIKNNRIAGNNSDSIKYCVYNDSTTVRNAFKNWWGAPSGPSGAGSGIGDSVGPYIDVSDPLPSDAPVNDSTTGCFAYANSVGPVGGNPISLRMGEKQFDATDLSIQTPAGALAFSHTYRQYKQNDATFDLMGLGWTHSQHYLLDDQTGETPPQLIFIAPDGGSVFFNVAIPTVDYDALYGASEGSTSQIAIDNGSSSARYIMTSGDKRVFEFDENQKLRKVTWSSGEYWIYTYYGDISPDEDTHFAHGELKEVIDDGYVIDPMTTPETKRKLQFVYTENPTFDNEGTPTTYAETYLLWRVGDHTAANLDSTPSGRYIELGYMPERNDSALVGPHPRALLAAVSDVRDDTRLWLYDYYGQHADEDETPYLNWLTSRQTPSVDIDGGGDADTVLIPEMNSYVSHLVDLAVNGNMEADDSSWEAIGEVTINERSQEHVAPGSTYSRKVAVNTVNLGIQGTVWSLVEGRKYTVTAKVYVVSTTGATPIVKMRVTDTTDFDQSTTLTDDWETLTVNDYMPSATRDCRLQFVSPVLSGSGTTTFYIDTVSITETNLQINQKRGLVEAEPDALLDTTYKFAPGLNYTTEELVGLTTTHQFQWGLYTGSVNPAGEGPDQGSGIQFRANSQIDAKQNTTALDWSIDGKFLNSVIDAAGNQTQFTYNEDETLESSVDAQSRTTQYIYADSTNPRLPTEIQVKDTDGVTVLRIQTIDYDSKGRVLSERLYDPSDPPPSGTPTQSVEREYYTSGYGAGLLKKVTQIDPDGNDQTSEYSYDEFGRTIEVKNGSTFGDCCGTETVYDAAGNVIESTSVRDWSALSDPVKNPVTSYGYDEIGRRVRGTTNVGTTFEQTTLTFYDALNRVTRTISNYSNPIVLGNPTYTAPGGWHWNGSAWVDQTTPTAQVISHGDDNTQNIISNTEYNARGMLRFQQDTLGNAILYGYDNAGHLVKTIQNASIPGYNNDYIHTSPDPTLVGYTPSGSADQDIITTSTYDAVGNVIKTVSPLGNLNAIPSTEDQVGYTTLTGYDSLNRPSKVIRNASQPDYDMSSDPQLAAYIPSTDPDKDMIDITEYDAMGRVLQTRHLLDNRPIEQWIVNRSVYDPLGRQVKTITNYVAQGDTDPFNWVWNSTTQRWEDGAGNAIIHSANNDQNLITETTYDANGRAQETRDTLGMVTHPVYDGLGRQVKSVTNYVAQGSTDPADWVWDATDHRWEDGAGTPISFGTDNDQNIISETIYDGNGRVQQTRDVLGRVSYIVYDDVGRAFRTIGNYLTQGSSNPFDWEWDTTDGRWEDGSGNPISFGTDNDQNIISETVYDDRGRVEQTYDKRHNSTRMVYDELGRQVTTITNYIVQGSSDPADWVWDATDGRWEDGAGTPISFGTDHDQNRISMTTYDIAGRVISNRDMAGAEAIPCYDRLGRRLKGVSNYIVQGSSNPADWVWDATDGRWEDGSGNPISFGTDHDQNLIGATVYNKIGQVLTTRDVRGTQSAFSYNKAGRRLTVAQAVGTGLVSTSYSCYDKAGRILRSIQNWSALTLPTPDAQDGQGNWSFVPENNGAYNDRDLVTNYTLDELGRAVQVINPAGDETVTIYDQAGQITWMSDPEYSVTLYQYDRLRRRTRVIQGYLPLPVDEKIAYYGYVVPYYQIFTMDPDGSNQTNISNSGAQDLYPYWSPDDSQIVFVSDRAGVVPTKFTDLYIMDADGSNQSRLTDFSGYAYSPTWSPDGKQICFIFKQNGIPDKYDLYLINTDGSNRRLLYSNPSLSVSRGVFSPDGQWIAFSASDDNFVTADIYVIRADGTQVVNLTQLSDSFNNLPAWSWDNRKLVFRSSRSGNIEIYVMNADGSHPVNLSRNTAADRAPDWSSDGTKIAFYSERDTPNGEIYVMDADGSNQTRLTTNTNYNQNPVWARKVVDPTTWAWNDSSGQWEYPTGNPISHGMDHDRNIIVDVNYDEAGRVLSQREPMGNLITYTYDLLDRRKTLVKPITLSPLVTQTCRTTYTDLAGGKSRVTMKYPGTDEVADYDVHRDFDRLGRLRIIDYNPTDPDPGLHYSTPNVTFNYDPAGNRILMAENDGTDDVRKTNYNYDRVHRLTAASFDTEGDGSVIETVSYEYDAGSLRTKLTLPGNLDIVYTYDLRGQLVSLTNWDSQKTQFAYDNVGRHIVTERANRLRSRYLHDAAGRLRQLRHTNDSKTIAHFEYSVDGRGNRTQALEALVKHDTGTTTISNTDSSILYRGAWSAVSGFQESIEFSASLAFLFLGSDNVMLKMGQGPDHSIYDVYIGGSLWQSFDGYAASSNEVTISIPLQGDGPYLFEIRNRPEKQQASTGYKVRFKSLSVDTLYDLHTITYDYDALSRVQSAKYYAGQNVAAIPFRQYDYTFDRAGNRKQQVVTVAGTPITTNYTYNEANQLTGDGTNTYNYDNNGNLVSTNSSPTHTWDRANRLLSFGGIAYKYDGRDNRIQKDNGVDITKYLLDLQPGLVVVLGATVGSDTTHFIHSPQGIHAQENPTGAWTYPVQDALGSVRVETDANAAIQATRHFDPFGNVFDEATASGFEWMPYNFTGEPRDENGLNYHRARYLNPPLGVWVSQDPIEGLRDEPMSLNGYSWVQGNVPNLSDSLGTYINDNIRDRQILDMYLRLKAGLRPEGSITQMPCAASPFGCDQMGNPINYMVVQGFNAPGYTIQSNCPDWGTVNPGTHCGIDIVSHADDGFFWNTYRESGTRFAYMYYEGKRLRLNLNTFEYGDYGFINKLLQPVDLQTGRAKIELRGYDFKSGDSQLKYSLDGKLGRKVYALKGGNVKSYSPEFATLKVWIDKNIASGANLEMQYTHIGKCSDASGNEGDPNNLPEKIGAGHWLGCYFVNSDKLVGPFPHLHLLYKQVNDKGENFKLNSECAKDIYLDPSNPSQKSGFGNDAIPMPTTITAPAHVVKYAYLNYPVWPQGQLSYPYE